MKNSEIGFEASPFNRGLKINPAVTQVEPFRN